MAQQATASAKRYQLRWTAALGRLSAITEKSQTTTASMMKPVICLKRSIQTPGFGRYFIQAGTAVSRKYGRLMPAATVANSRKITGADWGRAKPRLIARNGGGQ